MSKDILFRAGRLSWHNRLPVVFEPVPILISRQEGPRQSSGTKAFGLSKDSGSPTGGLLLSDSKASVAEQFA